MGFLRNIKHATDRNWHWALDQYVSPKNSTKSCQKYMKVVEYWYGTIKNNRYDGGVSVAAATSASGIATGGTTVVRFAAAALALMEAAHDHVEAAHAQLLVVTAQIE